jgi:hypothetical protein
MIGRFTASLWTILRLSAVTLPRRVYVFRIMYRIVLGPARIDVPSLVSCIARPMTTDTKAMLFMRVWGFMITNRGPQQIPSSVVCKTPMGHHRRVCWTCTLSKQIDWLSVVSLSGKTPQHRVNIVVVWDQVLSNKLALYAYLRLFVCGCLFLCSSHVTHYSIIVARCCV